MPRLPRGVTPEHRMKEVTCLACDDMHDAATGVGLPEGYQPEPGDITVCLTCGYVMAFTHDMSFRELTPEEKKEVEQNFGVQAVLMAQRALQGKRSNH